MEWVKKTLFSDAVRALASQYKVDFLTASVFLRRDVKTPKEILFYLEEGLQLTHNPFLFREMDDVIDRILGTRQEKEKVLVFGDRDADGIMSTVLMVEALQELEIETFWKVPEGDDPYGLSTQVVEWFASLEGTLIITVDCGISNVKEVALANSLGIDVIILDHHAPGAVLPQALAIVNPCLQDENYPFAFLAACGVVSKVIWALRFAQTPFYNRRFCLLRCYQSSAGIGIEAACLVNLVEQKRCYFTFEKSLSSDDLDELVHFFANQELVVFDEKEQRVHLKNLFGSRVQMELYDVAPQIDKAFPSFYGLTFAEITAKSQLERYQDDSCQLDVFCDLFISSVYSSWPRLGTDYGKILDLVSLGTLADLMPMTNENRILVRLGMQTLNQTSRQGLRALFLQLKFLGHQLSTTEVSWSIIPIINAAGRMGFPQKAVELFLTKDTHRQQALAQELQQFNIERRQLSQSIWEQILPQARDSLGNLQQRMVLVQHPCVLRGVTGILASRLMNMFGVPAIVMANQESRIVGSLRANGNFETRMFLDQFKDIFIDYGGHNRAGGFQLPLERTEEFCSRIANVLDDFPAMKKDEDNLKLDAELPQAYLTPQLWKVVQVFEPYGETNPPLVFACRGLKILSISLVGKTGAKHLKMTLEGLSHKWPAFYWNALDRFESNDFAVEDIVDVAFHLTQNHYQGQTKLQLNIIDLVHCQKEMV